VIVEWRNGQLVRGLVDDELQPTDVAPIAMAGAWHVFDGLWRIWIPHAGHVHGMAANYMPP
jgi:hypothetical protein